MSVNIFVLFLLISSCYSLKCYWDSAGSLASPSANTSMSECVSGSMACIKLIDYSAGSFMKGCSPQNCTMPNSTSQTGPAACYNTTKMNPLPGEQVHSTQSCCCYGDGCNSAGIQQIFLTMIVVAFAMMIKQ